MRNHATSINNGTLSRENSSKEPPPLQQGSNTESSRIDEIRIVGPSGEDKESSCIASAGASKGASGCIPEIKIQSTMPESSESMHTENRNDDVGTAEIVKGAEENSNDKKNQNIKSKYGNEETACAVSTEAQDRSTNHNNVNYFDQLAAIVTKLAITEVPRYYHKYKQEVENVRGVVRQENKGRAKYNQFRLQSHSKIHDYANGVTRSIMQMSKHEVARINRSKHGSSNTKVFNEETDFAGQREERHIPSRGTSNLDDVYKSDGSTRAKNGRSMIDTERASCGIITDSKFSRAVDSQDQLLKDSGYCAKQHSYVMDGSYDSPMLYGSKDSKAFKMSAAVCKGDLRSDSAHNSVKAAVERFAQSLAENIVKEAISEICRTVSFPFQKRKPLNMTVAFTTWESMQSKDARRCTNTWVDDHVTKISTKSKLGCSKVEFTKGNFLVETPREQVNSIVQKAAQSKQKASDFNEFSEQLSRIILTSAVFSLKRLELQETYGL